MKGCTHGSTAGFHLQTRDWEEGAAAQRAGGTEREGERKGT